MEFYQSHKKAEIHRTPLSLLSLFITEPGIALGAGIILITEAD